MLSDNIDSALAQVRRMQEIILVRKSFRGYNGKARMLGAFAALAGSLVMSRPGFPQADKAHLAGWLIVLAAALVLNYGALFVWFLFNKSVKRNAAMLVPAIDAVPSLAIGAVFTAACIIKGQLDLLPGAWMALYGLAHVAYRQSLPMTNYAVGFFYMASGAVCMLWPGLAFSDPWPMGIVFFTGELAGGYILHRNNQQLEREEHYDAR